MGYEPAPPAAAARRSRAPVLAALALALWAVHATDLVLRGEAVDLLWICNLSGPVLALGCALGARRLVAVPLLWLAFGSGLWILDMLGGGEVIPTAFSSHFGVLAVGVVVIRRLGWPRHVWWRASLLQLGVLLLSRVLTPPERNINLAFDVWRGWEAFFPSYWIYFCVILAGTTAGYAVTERLFVRLTRPS